MAANRDEVLETLWPELSPDAAGNSLHQAIYHLRRLIEPDFREWASANYITFDGDVVSLNCARVDTASRACWRTLGHWSHGGGAEELLDTYVGKYAIDFAYEDWANDYRERLHAAVLGAVEGDIVRHRQERDFDRAIRLAQRVLAIDPQADAIELELLRAYKASGRQSAAAEQYAHYSAVVREELGADPPSFSDV
jgi:DNA-binding SARP family transcriptional activator